MLKLVAVLNVSVLMVFVTLAMARVLESQSYQQVTNTLTFVLRLRNEYYNIKPKQEKLVKNIKSCANFCQNQFECVAFNCGPTQTESPAFPMFCSLIFKKDLSTLSSVGIQSRLGVNYYEMDCHQFCERHNAELKLLACSPLDLGLGISLVTLPKCKCDSIKPNCGILG